MDDLIRYNTFNGRKSGTFRTFFELYPLVLNKNEKSLKVFSLDREYNAFKFVLQSFKSRKMFRSNKGNTKVIWPQISLA